MIETDNELLPKLRFPARDRSGVFLGLSAMQVIVAGTAVLAVAVTMMTGRGLATTGIVAGIAAIPFTLAVWTVRGEALLTIALRTITYLGRKWVGQQRFIRRVWDIIRPTRRTPGAGEPAPQVLETVPLPGGLGDIALVQLPGAEAGGFAHNKAANLVSVTVRIRSRAWAMRDKSGQVAAYNGFVDWVTSLESQPGHVETVCRVRVDRASSTELADYVAARDAERLQQGLFAITPALEREYDELTGIGAQRAMAFTNTVTLVFDLTTIGRDVKAAGGGLTGIAARMHEYVGQVQAACEGAQVDFDGWMTATELDQAIWTAYDPVSTSIRRERTPTEDATRPVMGIEASWGHLRADGTLHRTYWIAEWPRVETRVGFLEPLLYSGLCPRTLTLQFRPVEIEKALTRINREQAKREFAETVNLKLRKRTTRREQREQEDLDVREDELVDGYGDLTLRGFVTISAEDEQALHRGQSEIEQAQHRARVKLVPMWGQQAAAFTTAVLPVPTGTK